MSLNLKNHFLIAMPNLLDPNFHQSVTYICEHDQKGAMGLMLTQTTNYLLGELLQQLKINCIVPEIGQRKIMFGGPVEIQSGFILHRPAGNWQSSLHVTEEVTVTTSRDILEALAVGQGPRENIVTVGYAGWGPGQLEQELASNSWLTYPADTDMLFKTSPGQLWHSAAKALGIDLSLLSGDVGHA
ncbi:MAG TPA: YqgE/AlgH family protein [Gammaproteobacteria bacterium]|jgi:putative transcriptional regulator